MAKTMEKSLAVANANVVLPAMSGDDAVKVWGQYQDLIKKVCTDDDYQVIEGKQFRKKSGWRKIATFFNLSTEVVEEKKEAIGGTYVWHFTVRATAPNGRSAIGAGSCDAFEKAKKMDGEYKRYNKYSKIWEKATPNTIHNIRSTAESRATSRAISNLVGGGEVSAEEVADTNGHAETPATPAVKQAVAAATGVCRYCGATGKYHKPNCPGATPVPAVATTSQEVAVATAATEPTVVPTDENGEVVNPEEIPF